LTSLSLISKSRSWRSVRLLVIFLSLVTLYLHSSTPKTIAITPAESGTGDEAYGVQVAADQSISLLDDAGAPPMTDSPYQRFGYYISPFYELAEPASQIKIRYNAWTPESSLISLDLRVSPDGENWTAWEIDLTNGQIVEFPLAATVAQYRARLFGSEDVTPVLHSVELEAIANTNQVFADNRMTDRVAPTFKVAATREGLVGHRTANGHIIQPRDRFVSLPSWRSLSSRGGNEYQVRITYKGRSAVAPVWDVGPWNAKDDYWNIEREMWNDLPRGWPQDHAAYFDGYNGGYAQYGYVTFPTAIDIGDGTWWDDLGLKGARVDEVEVTFLWLGRDPLEVPPVSAPSSDPNASEYMVDELGPAFHPNESQSLHSSDDEAWECGAGEHTYWSVTTTDENFSDTEVFWHPDLPIGGEFDLYAHIPAGCGNEYRDTQGAHYLVQHAEGSDIVTINQAAEKGWVHLGRFPFEPGAAGFVQLSDLAGDANHAIWFDNVKWVPVR
jgi:hypothetical protein